MWRAIFIALGLMAIIIGVESLFIESASFYSRGASSAFGSGITRQWSPQDWFPWVVLAGGLVVIIYAYTLPQRFGRATGG